MYLVCLRTQLSLHSLEQGHHFVGNYLERHVASAYLIALAPKVQIH